MKVDQICNTPGWYTILVAKGVLCYPVAIFSLGAFVSCEEKASLHTLVFLTLTWVSLRHKNFRVKKGCQKFQIVKIIISYHLVHSETWQQCDHHIESCFKGLVPEVSVAKFKTNH